ncbi:hypothetical protein GCM10016234_34690 [Tianweitania populi]|uniref:Uncharacterized protein n=1 Tax=Tianweitania populi TaxID=1607949 RepID=A0A8J3DSA0_9HYPH|nr:hypothetical protein GCM10016234_34690 [Tianweitania populi]
MHLTSAKPEQLGSPNDAQASVTNLLNDLEPMQLFLRHGDRKGHDDSDRCWSQPG